MAESFEESVSTSTSLPSCAAWAMSSAHSPGATADVLGTSSLSMSFSKNSSDSRSKTSRYSSVENTTLRGARVTPSSWAWASARSLALSVMMRTAIV